MHSFQQDQQAMRARVKYLEARVVTLEQALTYTLSGYAPPTTEQQTALVNMLKLLQAHTGIPFEQLADDLTERCGVAHLNAIPQATWPEVLTWIKDKIES